MISYVAFTLVCTRMYIRQTSYYGQQISSEGTCTRDVRNELLIVL